MSMTIPEWQPQNCVGMNKTMENSKGWVHWDKHIRPAEVCQWVGQQRH